MKIKKLVHIILDEEKHEDGKAEGTMTLTFTEATIEEILRFSQAAAKFRDRFEAKLVPHAADTHKKGGQVKWDIPFTYAGDRKAYQKWWKICKTLNMKYPEALAEMERRSKEKAAKSDPERQDEPADPPGQPAQKESPVQYSVEELQPGDHGTVEKPAAGPQPANEGAEPSPSGNNSHKHPVVRKTDMRQKPPAQKKPHKPSKPGKKEPIKSAFGFTEGDSVKMISGPAAVPGIGTVIGFSDNPMHIRKIQMKWFNNIRWCKPDQLELVKREEE